MNKIKKVGKVTKVGKLGQGWARLRRAHVKAGELRSDRVPPESRVVVLESTKVAMLYSRGRRSRVLEQTLACRLLVFDESALLKVFRRFEDAFEHLFGLLRLVLLDGEGSLCIDISDPVAKQRDGVLVDANVVHDADGEPITIHLVESKTIDCDDATGRGREVCGTTVLEMISGQYIDDVLRRDVASEDAVAFFLAASESCRSLAVFGASYWIREGRARRSTFIIALKVVGIRPSAVVALGAQVHQA